MLLLPRGLQILFRCHQSTASRFPAAIEYTGKSCLHLQSSHRDLSPIEMACYIRKQHRISSCESLVGNCSTFMQLGATRHYSTQFSNTDVLSLEGTLETIDSLLNSQWTVSDTEKQEIAHGISSPTLTNGLLISWLNQIFSAASTENNESFWNDARCKRLIQKLMLRLVSFTAKDLYHLLLVFMKSQSQAYQDEYLIAILDRLFLEDKFDALQGLEPAQASQIGIILSSFERFSSYPKKEKYLHNYTNHLKLRLWWSILRVSSGEESNEKESLEGGSSRVTTSPESSSSNSHTAKANAEISFEESSESLGTFSLYPFTLKDVTMIVVACSNLGCRDIKLLHELADYSIKASLFHPESLPDELKDTIHSSSMLSLTSTVLKTQTASLLLSFATLGLRHAVFYQQLLDCIIGQLPGFSSSQLTDVVMAVATLCRDPDFPQIIYFLHSLKIALSKNWQFFNNEDALTSCWGLCCIGIHQSDPEIILNLMRRIFSSPSFWLEIFNGESERSAQCGVQLNQIMLSIFLSKGLVGLKQGLMKLMSDRELWEPFLQFFSGEGKHMECLKLLEVYDDAANRVEDEIFEALTPGSPLWHALVGLLISGKEPHYESESSRYIPKKRVSMRNMYDISVVMQGPDKKEAENLLHSSFVEAVGEVHKGQHEEASQRVVPPGHLHSVAFVVDSLTYKDYNDPVDAYLALKNDHLRMMGFLVVTVKRDVWQGLADEASKAEYIKELIANSYEEHFQKNSF